MCHSAHQRDPHTYSLVLNYCSTNNKVEYDVLISRPLIAKGVGAQKPDVKYNS